MKNLVLSVLSVAVLLLSVMGLTSCDKFEGKTYHFSGVSVTYITEIDENGKVIGTETVSLDSYCADVLGISGVQDRLNYAENLKTKFGITQSYLTFSKDNTFTIVVENSDALTGEKKRDIVRYSYKLENDMIVATYSDLDENGMGSEYEFGFDIVSSYEISRTFWGNINASSTFSEDDVVNKTVFNLTVTYIAY